MLKLQEILGEEFLSSVSQKGLALAIVKNTNQIVLYDPKVFKVFSEKEYSDSIRGYLRFSWACKHNNEDVFTVESVAAMQGFGPLIYEILLSNRIVIPSKLTNENSKKVWRKFYERDDVEKIYIDNFECLNHTSFIFKGKENQIIGFTMKNPINYSVLEIRHKKFLQTKVSDAEFEWNLDLAGHDFFGDIFLGKREVNPSFFKRLWNSIKEF